MVFRLALVELQDIGDIGSKKWVLVALSADFVGEFGGAAIILDNTPTLRRKVLVHPVARRSPQIEAIR